MKERDPQKTLLLCIYCNTKEKSYEHNHRPHIRYHQFLNDNVYSINNINIPSSSHCSYIADLTIKVNNINEP